MLLSLLTLDTIDNTSELRRSFAVVYRTDRQALSTARFRRADLLSTADTRRVKPTTHGPTLAADVVKNKNSHQKVDQQLEPRSSAHNMTLPAFAAERRHLEQISIDNYGTGRSRAPSSKPAAQRCCCRSMGRTDRRTDRRTPAVT